MKTSTFLMISLMAISLSACGATTGGVAKSQAQQAAVKPVSSELVTPQTSETLETSTTDTFAHDANMDCAALSSKMVELDTIISSSNTLIAKSESSEMTNNLAKAGASRMASKALSKVPFAGMFAKSAVDSLTKSERVKMEQAQINLLDANLRKANLSGLYAGKNCEA